MKLGVVYYNWSLNDHLPLGHCHEILIEHVREHQRNLCVLICTFLVSCKILLVVAFLCGLRILFTLSFRLFFIQKHVQYVNEQELSVFVQQQSFSYISICIDLADYKFHHFAVSVLERERERERSWYHLIETTDPLSSTSGNGRDQSF